MPENFPWVLLLLIFFFECLLDFSPFFRSPDPSATEPMETEVADEENVRSNTDVAIASEGEAGAGNPTGEEAAKAAAAEAGEGSGDRTDGPEAAGAPGATPTADPSAAAAASGSKEPQPGAYLKAGDGIFIKLQGVGRRRNLGWGGARLRWADAGRRAKQQQRRA